MLFRRHGDHLTTNLPMAILLGKWCQLQSERSEVPRRANQASRTGIIILKIVILMSEFCWVLPNGGCPNRSNLIRRSAETFAVAAVTAETPVASSTKARIHLMITNVSLRSSSFSILKGQLASQQRQRNHL